MIKNFRFKDVRKYLEKRDDSAILDIFDRLTGAAIIFTPLILGPQFLPVLDLLAVKDELFNIGKKVVNFVVSKQECDFSERAEQMQIAYGLICYTSYFEALADAIPKDVHKKLKLKYEDKVNIIKEATQSKSECTDELLPNIHNDIPFPDQIISYEETKKHLEILYSEITKTFEKLIFESSILEKEQRRLESLKNEIQNLPKKAIQNFENQYFELAASFNEFFIYVQNLELHNISKALFSQSKYLLLLNQSTKNIDVGLVNLCEIVQSMPTEIRKIQAQEIVDDLKLKYDQTIQEPIIDNKEIVPNSERNNLEFPKIVDAFIPQSYKCLSYNSRDDIRLENETTWQKLEKQNDLNRFFVKYLCSRESIEVPLVILGHPGSGKSLLTKVLSAQLMCNAYTVIRIPLREVNADLDISILVEEQIRKVTNQTLPNGWGGFAKQFSDKPLIIILDGYDELLQAKGQVFAGYLEKIRGFQQDQKVLKRPVRVIVTSRITLIDKAKVPSGSTILRLLEFNEDQRNAWIKIWNATNMSYFNSSNPVIKPFLLPCESNYRDAKNSILELAEQPLLLLMLALYDSEDNSLSRMTKDINRTALYDSLLRRFIRRERGRYVTDFDNLDEIEQEKLIDFEMQRLGVVAIGMYNRRKLFILSKELDIDLKFYVSERADSQNQNKSLKDSESLLGGFFFIHQSTAQDVSENSTNSDSAFEFLHNTFGEFLTADFLLGYTIKEAKTINHLRRDNYFKDELRRKLDTPDGFCKEWLACLMFTPLYSRPVIVEMIQEHIKHVMKKIDISEEDFKDNFKIMLKSQLRIILNSKQFPQVMSDNSYSFLNMPLLGYISTYSLNLIILASVLCPEGFEFDEHDYSEKSLNCFTDSETRPWDKLANLWRTWFSMENLSGLSVILKAQRLDGKIIINCNDKFESESYNQSIDIILCVSNTLADNLTLGLSGLQTQHFSDITKMTDDDISNFLKTENGDLYLSFIISLLRKSVNSEQVSYKQINELLRRLVAFDLFEVSNNNILLSLFDLIEILINRKLLYFELRKELTIFLESSIEKLNHRKKAERNLMHALRIYRMLTNENDIILNKRILYDKQIVFLDDVERFENDRIFLYHKRIMKGNVLYHQEFVDEINNNQLFFSFIDNSQINPKERLKTLKKFLEQIDIIDLVRANPEYAYRVLKLLITEKNFNRTLIEECLWCFLEQIKIIGFKQIGYTLIINFIKIALEIHANKFCESIQCVLKDYIFRDGSNGFMILIFYNPAFICEILELFPNLIMHEESIQFTEKILYMVKKEIQFKSQDNFLDFIKLMRKLIEILPHNSNDLLKLSSSMLEKNLKFNFEWGKINMMQFQNLYWFAKITNNEKLYSKIEKHIFLPVQSNDLKIWQKLWK